MMQTSYLKQYPDLWVDKTIMYVHGFASSAQSGTVKRIQDTFPNARVMLVSLPTIYPFIPKRLWVCFIVLAMSKNQI